MTLTSSVSARCPLGAGGLVLLLAVTGCAYQPTPRLPAYNLAAGYRFESDEASRPKNSEELFVVLAFSGGGTRAAAFSYGALRQLDGVRFHINEATGEPEACAPAESALCNATERTLLDEVDVISSVSGGSFTSAYYALNGREIFDPKSPFQEAFLYHQVQRDLFSQSVYYPQNWNKLSSRIEIAANYYADHIFGDATFEALEDRERPYLILNATDMSTGGRFEFTQEQFDLFCGDLSQLPISRGVAASSAFPGLLDSMTIDSYARTGCGYTGPGSRAHGDWVADALEDGPYNRRRYRSALLTRQYLDKDRLHFHLLDGGLADNIGLRSVLQSLTSLDTPIEQTAEPNSPIYGGWSLMRMIDRERVKNVVVVVVNARTSETRDWDQRAAGPGLITEIRAARGIPMGNFSYDTVQMLQDEGFDFARRRDSNLGFYAVEVAFENIGIPAEREFFNNLPTSFTLSPYEVNCLADRGATLLREAPTISEGQSRPFEHWAREVLKATVEPSPTLEMRPCNTDVASAAIGVRTHHVDVGADFGIVRPGSGDVEPSKGPGMALRVTRPNGFGAMIDFSPTTFEVRSVIKEEPVRLGRLRLFGVAAGVGYTRHLGQVEATLGVTVGYGFGAFELSDSARDVFRRQDRFGVSGDATNAWLVRPQASFWYSLNPDYA